MDTWDVTHDTPTPVLERCHSCIASLKAIRSVLSSSSSKSHLSPGQVNEELERLSLWMGNIGALHEPGSPLSMESRLREAQDVLSHIQKLLRDVDEVAGELLQIASGEREGEVDYDSLDEDTNKEVKLEEINEESELLQEMGACITRLFRASSLIRQAAPTDLFARALLKNRLQFDDQFDIAHVSEKFPKLGSDESQWLRKRLGQAITKRRQYLSYIQQHRDKLGGTQSQPIEPVVTKSQALSVKQPQTFKPVLADSASRPSTYVTKASTLTPGHITPQMLTAEEESGIEDDSRSYTTISRSVDGDHDLSSLARIPKLSELRVGVKKEVECPFCFRIKRFKNEKVWRKHVFSDLRSYVCTFPGCDAQLFGDINEWFHHEMQSHRISYTCRFCSGRTFNSQDKFLVHVRHKHSELLENGEEQSLLDISHKPLDQIPARDCPCCDDWVHRLEDRESTNNASPNGDGTKSVIAVLPPLFKRHLAAHLEQLSVFAIPNSLGLASDDNLDSNIAIKEANSAISKSSKLSSLMFASTRNSTGSSAQVEDTYQAKSVELEPASKSDVREFIRSHMVSYKFRGYPQKFLPRSALDTITKRAIIRQVIAQDKKMILNHHEQEEMVDRVYRCGRKIFATCVDCDKSMKHVLAMLDNDLTDESLPLSEDDFGSLSQKGAFVNSFVSAQKRFNTVFFSENQFAELDDNLSDRFSIPIHFEEIEAHFKGKGAFGAVYQVKIHPDQRSFSCETNNKDLFAMKITQHEGRELRYHRAMVGLEHPHLVRCLTSFTLGAKHHMVYQLANSDLESFIFDNPNASRNPRLSELWLAQQFVGLAGAVQVVHNPEGSLNSAGGNILGIPSANPQRTGYIHDIKPENILVFKKQGGPYLLRLSDFSCARVAEVVMTLSGKRDSYKTGSKSGTPAYRAPESLENATSRPYDMWSLGCVYLEVLVWYLDGYQALLDFRESREGQVHPYGLEDEGFYHYNSAGVIELRKPVMDMIEYLSKRYRGALKDIIEIIPSLLQINPKARPSATELVRRLGHLGPGPGLITYSVSQSATGPSQDIFSHLHRHEFDNDSDSDSSSDFGGMIKVTRPSDG